MAAFWRQVGMNYVQFSAICARIVRSALKPQYRPEVKPGADAPLKVTRWENGKPIKPE